MISPEPPANKNEEARSASRPTFRFSPHANLKDHKVASNIDNSNPVTIAKPSIAAQPVFPARTRSISAKSAEGEYEGSKQSTARCSACNAISPRLCAMHRAEDSIRTLTMASGIRKLINHQQPAAGTATSLMRISAQTKDASGVEDSSKTLEEMPVNQFLNLQSQERALIGASRDHNLSLDVRVRYAHRASDVHEKRTGRTLKFTEQDLVDEDMYEEELLALDGLAPVKVSRIGKDKGATFLQMNPTTHGTTEATQLQLCATRCSSSSNDSTGGMTPTSMDEPSVEQNDSRALPLQEFVNGPSYSVQVAHLPSASAGVCDPPLNPPVPAKEISTTPDNEKLSTTKHSEDQIVKKRHGYDTCDCFAAARNRMREPCANIDRLEDLFRSFSLDTKLVMLLLDMDRLQSHACENNSQILETAARANKHIQCLWEDLRKQEEEEGKAGKTRAPKGVENASWEALDWDLIGAFALFLGLGLPLLLTLAMVAWSIFFIVLHRVFWD